MVLLFLKSLPFDTFHLGTLASIVFLAVLFGKNHMRKRKDNPAGLSLPPGPPRLSIVAALFGSKDNGEQWLTYKEWAKTYGDLLYTEVSGQKTLVINSNKIAEDLLEKRSQIYSDRPQVFMHELMGWKFSIGFLPYGTRWRKLRKAMHQELNRSVIPKYHHNLRNAAHQLVGNLAHKPEDMQAHLRMFVTSTIMSVMYGYKVAPHDDLFTSLSDRATDMLDNSFFPGASLLNNFPILQHLPEWFPGAGFKRYAKISRNLVRQLCDLPFEFVQKQMTEGIAPRSVTSEMLGKNEDEDVIKAVGGSVYSAAVGTSAAILSSFVMVMIMFPDVRKKAQTEIDRITGGTRMPDFSDRSSMVYLDAIYREVQRWCQITPLSLPHITSGHDVYNAYFIPKDTVVLPNVWSMMHDERKYSDPMRFMPERFINAEGRLTADLAEQQFGFGRRVCPGKHLAEAMLWIAMASILAVFDVEKAKDSHGREIEVVARYTPGVLSHPMPYSFSITPRSPQTAQLIREVQVDG